MFGNDIHEYYLGEDLDLGIKTIEEGDITLEDAREAFIRCAESVQRSENEFAVLEATDSLMRKNQVYLNIF